MLLVLCTSLAHPPFDLCLRQRRKLREELKLLLELPYELLVCI